MRNTFKLFGLIALFAIIAFPVAALGKTDKSKSSTTSGTSGTDRRADLKGTWVVPGGYYPTAINLFYEVEADGTVITELELIAGGGGDKYDLVSYDGTIIKIGNYTGAIMTGTAKITGNTLVISGLKNDEDNEFWLEKFNETYEKHGSEQSYDDGER